MGDMLNGVEEADSAFVARVHCARRKFNPFPPRGSPLTSKIVWH